MKVRFEKDMTMTGEEYRASLRDGRRVFHNGQLVDDVTTHPRFRVGVDSIAKGYDDSAPNCAGESEALYSFPRSVDDLRQRMALLSGWEVTRATTLESLLALQTVGEQMAVSEPQYHQRIADYVAFCRRTDRRCVQTITDAKGDRSKSPSEQDDPDAYLRVIEEDERGIVIQGAKLHISGAAIAHELVVIPTKRMKVGEEQWAVSCAVPVNSPGITILNTNPAPDERDFEYHPVSRRFGIPDGLVVFDHVFVPHDRVFLCGEVAFSASFAHALGLWQRIGGVARMADEADVLVGLAQLLAEANGLTSMHHIRDKIADIVIYAAMIRACLEAAIAAAETTEAGFVIPNEVYTNVAKYYGSAELGAMLRNIHDIGGGAILTAPLPGDLQNPETRALVDKYMRTTTDVSGIYRTKLFYSVRDLTADTYGGWWQVSSLMSGGGLHAQKLVARKNYDMARAKQQALIFIGEEEGRAT
jgi:4-hydroxybutyryl-CoA dehydratase / vinylacetyl-CoA-Delta-isomerase